MPMWTNAAFPIAGAAAITTMLGSPAWALAEPPPVFTELKLDEAVERSKEEGKILVVKATAEWCGPCKMMDKTTWVDEDVVAWVGEHGIAIQLDVDKSRADAQKLRVRAMPTMIAFKDGEEFDRIVGYRDATALLEWLGAVDRGERAADAVVKQAEEAKGGAGNMGMQQRMQMARQLVQAEKYDEATEEFLWLWENMVKREPSMHGVRNSFLVGDMQRLAEAHPPARSALMEVRDRAEARLRGEKKSWDDLDDWICLNEAVGEEDKTLAWFDRIKGDPESAQTLQRTGFRLAGLLEERGRWTDLPLVYPNPVAEVRRDHQMLKMTIARFEAMKDAGQEGMEAEMVEWQRDHFRRSAGKLYAAYLAAGRAADADQIAAEALKLDDSGAMRVALVETAISLRQPRDVQHRWLDEAEKEGLMVRELRRRLEEMFEAVKVVG